MTRRWGYKATHRAILDAAAITITRAADRITWRHHPHYRRGEHWIERHIPRRNA